MATSAAPAPPLPGKAALETANRGLLTLAIMGATVMQILDTTIANVALPHMQTSLGATLDTVTWVLTSYIIAAAVATPMTGWLSDKVGARNLFLASVAGFVLASMACGLATNLPEMVLFRALQGITGAFISPLAQTTMLDINPPERHAKAMSIWSMGIMIGPIAGPVLGGFLTDNYSWRWVFYVNVPVGIATFALLWWLMPNKVTAPRRFDHLGFWALAIALAALQLLLDRGHQNDWYESWETWIETGLVISGLWVFGVQMATSPHGLFPRQILTDRSFMVGMIFMAVLGMIMTSGLALMPNMLQSLFGYSVVQTGLLMMARAIGVLISMILAARLNGKVDARILMAAGLGIIAWSSFEMAHWSLDMDWHPIVTTGFFQGLGVGFIFVPLMAVAFVTVAPQFRTDGSSMLSLFRSLGQSVGISIVTVLLARNIQVSHADVASTVDGSTVAMIDAATLDRFQGYGQAALAYVDGMVNRQAAMIAYLDDFYFVGWMTACVIPLVLLLRTPRASAEAPHVALE